MKVNKKIVMGALSLMLATTAIPAAADGVEKTPAFPGAEGFGRYVTGGRGGKVYHVTNLNDSGEGSLRWALGQNGAKIIVFDVSGTIHLNSALNITSNTTVAGQTAPGDGICLADYPVAVKGNNVIVRYMRFRLGNKYVLKDGADGWDAFGGMDQERIMIDHCSVSWSIDECCSFLGNKNTTLQWSIVSQSLVNSGHTKGNHGYGGNWGGSGASFHHNLIAHHASRTPRLGPRPTTQMDERMDMRNNVIYNFGGNGCYGGEGMTVNIVNNYYKPGPGTPSGNKGKRIAGIGIRTNKYVETYPAYAPALHMWGKYYVTGNVNPTYADVTKDNWTYGIYNQITASDCDGTYTAKTKDTIKIDEPMPFIVTTTHTAEQAYEKVLAYAGASLSRDSHDELIVSDARNGKASYTGSGNSKGFINSQDDNKPSGAGSDWSAWPTLNSTTAPVDTDGDGMPDAWERANGLNPDDAADGALVAANGYTNVENYLNSLVETITTAQNADGTLMGGIELDGEEPEVTEYVLAQSTSNDDWTFSNGFSITTSNGYANGTGCGIKGIKYSRNSTFYINIPEGIEISKAEFKGYCNSDGKTAYLHTFANSTYSSTEYTFPPRDLNEAATHMVTLTQNATGSVPLRFSGDAQVVMEIKLFVPTSTGIEDVMTVPIGTGNDKIYTLDGRRLNSDINSLGKGIYIINNRKVVIK